MFVLDAQGRYLDVPGTVPELTHRFSGSLIGKTVYDLFPPSTAELFLAHIKHSLACQDVSSLEYCFVVDGSRRWYSATVQPCSADTVIWLARNVTELKRSEQIRDIIAKLGEQLSGATGKHEAAEAMLHAAHELLGWDAGFVDLFSAEREELNFFCGFDTIDGQRIPAAEPLSKRQTGPLTLRAMREGAFMLNRPYKDQDCTVAFGASNRKSQSLLFVPIRHSGQNVGVLSIQSYTPEAYNQEDLDLLQTLADYGGNALQRTLAEEMGRAAEQARLDEQQRFRAMLEISSEGVLLVGADQKVRYSSRSACEITGLTETELQGSHFLSLVHPEDRIRVSAEVLPNSEEDVYHAQVRFLHASEAWRWCTVYIRRLPPQEDGASLLLNFRDISEEWEGTRLREVLAQLGKTLSAVSTPRQAANAVLTAAHDLLGYDAAFVDARSTGQELRLDGLVACDIINGVRQEVPYDRTGKIPGPFSRKAIEEGAHIVLRKEPDSEGLPFGDRTRISVSLMFAPMRGHHGECTGILSIQSYTQDAYTSRDLALLQMLADYGSAAIRRTLAELRSRETEEALVRNERRFRAVIENSSDATVLMDEEGKVTYVTSPIQRILGFTAEEFLLKDPVSLIHPEDLDSAMLNLRQLAAQPNASITAHLRMRRADNTWCWIEAMGRNLMHEPEVRALVASIRDVTENHLAQEQLKHGAYHDSLTGLPNRMAFVEQLELAVARKDRQPHYGFAVLFLDLDRFKVVNDSLGHMVGDMLLIQAAQRLRECLRGVDVAARLGGDEFAILLDDIEIPGDATRVAERVQSALSLPFEVDGSEIFTSASIGIALSTTGYVAPDAILRDADTAMYRAKGEGKSQYAIFDGKMHERAVSLLQMENDLRRAVDRNEFVLHYQPVVELDSGRIIGFEALVRWQHPEKGLIMPGEFIALAEETGLIVPMGWIVLREACRWMRDWQLQSSFGRRMSISVNFSGRQFTQPDLVPYVESILHETGINARALKLEITEGTIVHNEEAAALVLARLKQLQIQLHVDDFGTGYSSLSYLHRFPIDALKIDRSFVHNLGNSEEAVEISRAVVALARNMRMEAIAEGIETMEQLEQLRRIGCTAGQGYLFSKPVPAEEARRLIDYTFDANTGQMLA